MLGFLFDRLNLCFCARRVFLGLINGMKCGMDLQNNTSAWPRSRPRSAEDTSRSDAADKQDLCLLQVTWHKGSKSPYSLTWRSLTSSPLSRPGPRRGEPDPAATCPRCLLKPSFHSPTLPEANVSEHEKTWTLSLQEYFLITQSFHTDCTDPPNTTICEMCVCVCAVLRVVVWDTVRCWKCSRPVPGWAHGQDNLLWNFIVKLKLLQRLLSAGCNPMFCKNQYRSEIQREGIYFITYKKQVRITSCNDRKQYIEYWTLKALMVPVRL